MCLSLICRRRRAYIPPLVHFTEDPFGQNLNSVDITSGFKEVSLPFCHRSTSTILISRRHRAWRIRQPSAQRERRSSAEGLLSPLVPCVANETTDSLTTGVIYLSGFRQWKYSQILRQASRLQALGQILRIFRL